MKDRALDDEAIMTAILNGRKSAMKALVEKYKRKAYYLAMGMVGNSDEAFDISQEAFVRVFRSAKRFNPGQKFFPWFYSIIVNLCRDVLKRRETKESREVSIDDNVFLLVDSANPEAELIRKEEAEGIRKALMKLDFDDREIIMLRHFREMSYHEISSLLKIPRGTVMSRLYYARKKLAKLLNEI